MKAYICDVCKVQVPPDGIYDLPPMGWYNVTKRTPTEYDTKHICGPTCLQAYAGEQQAPVEQQAQSDVHRPIDDLYAKTDVLTKEVEDRG